MRRGRSAVGHAAMLVVSLVFGGFNVILQWALAPDAGSIPFRIARSAVFTLYRDVGASLLLLGSSFASGQLGRSSSLLKHHSCAVVQAGACGIGSGIFFTCGLALTNAACAGLLQPAVPVLTVAFGLMLGLERRSLGKCFAVALSIAGALVAVDFAALSVSSAVGWLSLLLNDVCLAVWLIQQRRLLDRGFDPLTLTAAMYCVGTVFVLFACVVGFAIAPNLLREPGSLSLNAKELVALAYATAGSSALCYALITWASARLDPSIISLWASGQGCFTLLISLLVFGTLPSAMQLLGGLLISLGLCACVAVTMSEERASSGARSLLTDAQRIQPSDSGSGTCEGAGEPAACHDASPITTSPSPAPSPPYLPLAGMSST
jgi:drug/metabolite transporter (DMT)-like permease